jgi:hypothetical protein
MPGVFISYRKDDTRAWAISLRDHLARTLGERQIFFDVDSMNTGPWRTQIDRALDRCVVVLVLIGPRWAAATDAAGRQRLSLSDDVHRLEIASALKRPGMTVVPVLVDGATLPKADELPEDVRGLLECQASEIGDGRDARVTGLGRLTSLVDELSGQRRGRRHALAAVVATVAAGIVNMLVSTESSIVGIAFLLVAAGLGGFSLRVFRRMAVAQMKGAWVALVALILSSAMVVGSILRLVVERRT